MFTGSLPSNGRLLWLSNVTVSVLSSVHSSTHTLLSVTIFSLWSASIYCADVQNKQYSVSISQGGGGGRRQLLWSVKRLHFKAELCSRQRGDPSSKTRKRLRENENFGVLHVVFSPQYDLK